MILLRFITNEAHNVFVIAFRVFVDEKFDCVRVWRNFILSASNYMAIYIYLCRYWKENKELETLKRDITKPNRYCV